MAQGRRHAIEYFKWSEGEPNNWNHGGVTENYIGTWRNGGWNDFADATAAGEVNIVCQQNQPECCSGCSPSLFSLEHHLKPTCDLGVTITTGQGDSTLGFTFKSFKWSTTKNGNNDQENQDLTCSIALAKTPTTVTPQTCGSTVTWTMAAGKICDGNAIEQLNLGEDECKTKCLQTSDCVAIMKRDRLDFCWTFTANNCISTRGFGGISMWRKN